jgi:preprotein translocase subunit SecE
VARNRKRAKERRAKRTDGGYGGRRVAAAGGAEPAPSPIEHATPDVELADAQLAVGRAEPLDEIEEDLEVEDELEPEEAEAPPGGGGRRRSPPDGREPGGPVRRRGGEFAAPAPGGAVAPARVGLITRLIGFLQGSWRELQRVQWPDRRQVAQATSVVVGFVIVAGVFLGVADLAFSHLVNYILK